MSTSFWIGIEDDQFTVGQSGFLVETSHALKGWTRHELRDHPPKTNQSFVPCVHGWCGSYNDVSVSGCGLAIVERVARNGRAMVRRLTRAEAVPILEELGYPDLAGELET